VIGQQDIIRKRKMPEHTRSFSNPSTKNTQQAPLLEPKFHPPRLDTTLVTRERLLAKLDAMREQKLTLLCAPAGFGKTTLISQWMAHMGQHEQEPLIAWVALESGDNDPLRFWRYVMTACRAFHAEIGRAALAQISAELPPFEIPLLEMLLTLLLNDRHPDSTKLLDRQECLVRLWWQLYRDVVPRFHFSVCQNDGHNAGFAYKLALLVAIQHSSHQT